MTEYDGRIKPTGRVAIVVSDYHRDITGRLLRGAREVCAEADIEEIDVDVLHVSGAFELGVVATAAAHSGRYTTIVALGAVVRGETPHFDFIARETAAALSRAATDSLVPVGFGLLTCDTMDQAMARAGGTSGNKGREATEAALRATSLIQQALDE